MEFKLAPRPITSKDLILYVMWQLNECCLGGMNEVQVQKLAYMVYGFYLASTGKRIVYDEYPRACPSGPIFMKASMGIFKTVRRPICFGDDIYNTEKIEDEDFKSIIKDVVNTYGFWDSKQLVARSFLEDSPRSKTRKLKCDPNHRYSDDIDDELTYEYFLDKTGKNNISIKKWVNSKEVIDMYKKLEKRETYKKEDEKNKVFEMVGKNGKEVDDREFEKRNKSAKLKEVEDKIKHRDKFVKRVIRLVSIFLGLSLIIVVFCDNIANSVKITILSSTTATIIGLPLVIVRGLFLDKKE